RHAILATAVWMTRIDRAKRLLEVPLDNVDLAKTHYERMKSIFPEEFTVNPFDVIADRIEELGLSFEELPQSGFDAEIDWTEAEAIRGEDQPDQGYPTKDATSRTAFHVGQ